MSEELRPHVREYGGGDDRWCWSREQFTKELWDLLCDRHGREFSFAEYKMEAEAWQALGYAITKLVLRQLGKHPLQTAKMVGKTYRPQPTQPVYVSAFSARPDTRTIGEVLRVPKSERTKRDVLRLKTEAAVYGGCCDRFAETMDCNCLEKARDE